MSIPSSRAIGRPSRRGPQLDHGSVPGDEHPVDGRQSWAATAESIGGGVAVAAIALKTVLGVARVRDVYLNDETGYLASGVRLFVPGFPNDARGLPPAEWSPLYACWYWLLHIFVRNPIGLYYVNWSLLVVLIAVELYVLERRLGVHPIVALATTSAVIASKFFDVWPYPTDFVVLLYLTGALLALRAKSAHAQARTLLLTAIAIVFVRPEMALAAGMIALWTAYVWTAALRRGDARPVDIVRHLAVVAVAGALPLALFGSPLGGDRSFFAWAQHYALGQVTRHHLDVNPWLNWSMFVWRDFGHVTTIGQALRANPSAFLANIALNIQTLPSQLGDTLTPLPFFPPRVLAALCGTYEVVGAVGVLGLVARLRRGGPDARPLRLGVVMWLPVAANTLAAAILIYPRLHYLLLAMILGVALIVAGLPEGMRVIGRFWRRMTGLAIPERAFRGPFESGAALASAALLFLTFVPSRAYGACPQTLFGWVTPPASDRFDTLATVDVLRSLNIKGRVVVLEQGYSYAFYAGFDFVRFLEWTKDWRFGALLHDSNIGLVVLSPDLDQNPAFTEDPDYVAFVRDPGRFGFRVVPVPGHAIRLALRSDVETR